MDRSLRTALAALAALLPIVCVADKANEKPIAGQTLSVFESEAANVRAGMQPGGVYGFMKDEDKARAEQRLDDMHRLLASHPNGDLSPQDKIDLVNTQEALNALLLQNDSNRLICEHSAHTGSRIKVTTCVTYGEIMKRREQDQQTLGDIQRQPQTQIGTKRDGG